MIPVVNATLGQHAAPDTDDMRHEGPGDRNIFSAGGLDAIYRHFAPRLVRRLARRVGSDEAIEVVHETFAKLACPTARPCEPIDRPEAFITTVATNVLRDRAREAARRALQAQHLALEPQESVADPHRIFEGREALRAIERALAAMSPRRREIFLLHRFQQMTYAEIGGVTGMSEKGVKKQIAKALVELRSAAGRSE